MKNNESLYFIQRGHDMKPIEMIKQAERDYQAGKVAEVCGVVTRTVSLWCEKGLIVSETTGRGDRRKFTALQVVEIAIIAGLSNAGMSSKRILGVMEYLRRNNGVSLKNALADDYSFLIVPITDPGPIKMGWDYIIESYNEGERIKKTEKEELLRNLFRVDIDRMLILNIGRIATHVMAKL